MRKLITLTANPDGWRPFRIYRDEEQLRAELIEDWGLEGDFDLDEELERQEMKKAWCEDYSDKQ